MQTINKVQSINNLEIEELLNHNMHIAHMSREERVKVMLNKLGLTFDYVQYLNSFNKGKNNPYHNNEHCYTVALRSMEIAVNDFDLTAQEIRQLFIAGLFHDFNHSGGFYEKDEDNVKMAVKGITDLFKSDSLHYEKELIGEDALEKIVSLIKITEYQFKKVPVTNSEKIIRDADLLQYVDGDKEDFISGLGKELKLNIDFENTKEFLKAQNMYTEYGEKLMQQVLGS